MIIINFYFDRHFLAQKQRFCKSLNVKDLWLFKKTFCDWHSACNCLGQERGTMLDSLQTALTLEILIIANAILAVTIVRYQLKKKAMKAKEIAQADVLAIEEELNLKAKALYDEMKFKSQRQTLSLSLGQEDKYSSSCPSFYQFVCDEDSDEWVLTC